MTPYELLAKVQALAPLDRETKRAREDRDYIALQRRFAAGLALAPEQIEYLKFYHGLFTKLSGQPIPSTQSLIDFYYLARLREAVEEAIRAHLGPLPPLTVVLGTLDVMTIDAVSFVANEHGDRLIVVNTGLLGAISAISNLIAFVAHRPGPFLVQSLRAERIGMAKTHLVRIIAKYILNIDDSEDYTFLPIEDATRTAGYWRFLDMAVKTFVVGHEYAHCLLALGDAWTGREQLDLETSHLLERPRLSWTFDYGSPEFVEEVAADELGFYFLQWAAEVGELRQGRQWQFGLLSSWQAAVLFFEIVNLYDRVFGVWRSPDRCDHFDPRKQHPAPKDRMNKLAEKLARTVGQRAMQDLMDVRFGITNSVATLWNLVEDEVETIKNAHTKHVENIRHYVYGVAPHE